MAFGWTQITNAEILKLIGIYRNQAIFAFFLLEEAYQCLNITINLMYMKHERAEAYRIVTHAISDVVSITQFCKNPTISSLIYPTNLGYLSFFRAELIAFMEIRNRIIIGMGASGITYTDGNSNGNLTIGYGEEYLKIFDAIVNSSDPEAKYDWFLQERDNGSFVAKQLSDPDIAVFENPAAWDSPKSAWETVKHSHK